MNQQPFSRREFLRIIGATAAVGAAWKLGLRAQEPKVTQVSVSRVLMGTVVNLTLIGADRAAAQTAVTTALDEMSRLESLLSRFNPDSELSRLNRDGYLSNASRPLLELVQTSRRLSEQSSGAFDISVKTLLDLYREYQQRGELPPPAAVAGALTLVNYKDIHVEDGSIRFARAGMGVTLDGIGKGLIVDAGTAVLRQHGFVNVLVEAGGDLMAAGAREPERPWRIGLQSPRPQTELAQTSFTLQNRAAATSGDYMHSFAADLSQHHIIDPRTGYSSPELASVTVTAPSAMLADGLATAVMVLGRQTGIDLVNGFAGCEALLITKDIEVVSTARLYHFDQGRNLDNSSLR